MYRSGLLQDGVSFLLGELQAGGIKCIRFDWSALLSLKVTLDSLCTLLFVHSLSAVTLAILLCGLAYR